MGVDTSLKGVPNVLQSFEIIKTGRTSVTKPMNESAASTVIPHGLGFTPLAFVFNVTPEDDFSTMLPSLDLDLTDGSINQLHDATCNETQLEISIQAPVPSSSYGAEVTDEFVYFLVRQKSS